ncbi:hypothetical protein C8J56DRAFT_25841 [Mycena floridula]|nr:hypothetical protein C8J56DRAFT_25841 [Mycena floridula]
MPATRTTRAARSAAPPINAGYPVTEPVGEFFRVNGHMVRLSGKQMCRATGSIMLEFADSMSEPFQRVQPPPGLIIMSERGVNLPFMRHDMHYGGFYLVQLCDKLKFFFNLTDPPILLTLPNWPYPAGDSTLIIQQGGGHPSRRSNGPVNAGYPVTEPVCLSLIYFFNDLISTGWRVFPGQGVHGPPQRKTNVQRHWLYHA